MRKKRIDIVVKYFIPVIAGIETNILNTYSILVKNGWDVYIHTSNNTLTEKNILVKKETINGLKIRRYQYKWYSFFPLIKWNSTNIVALHNFDILPHLFIMLYSIYLKLLKKKTFSLVVTPHGGFNPEWRIFSRLIAISKRFYHYTFGTLLVNLSVDLVRAVSEWEGDQITSKGVKKDKVIVIPNGVEDEAYKNVNKFASEDIKQKVRSYGEYIVQIGRIYKIKNYETTIKSLTKIPEHINFVITGPMQENSNYKEKLEILAKKLGVSHRLIFTGVISGIDKYYLIKHAQMMVHMAIWESFCNVIHEGLSQGLICIVANNTALPYLIKDNINGYCVNTFDDKMLAKKINYVLKNRKTKEMIEMKERNRKYGLEDSWKSVARKVEFYYKLQALSY